jgi:hypothetical protein
MIEVYWHEGYGNMPQLIVNASRLSLQDIREGSFVPFKVGANKTLWVWEQDNGFVRAYLADPKNTDGLGGAVVTLRDKNGIVRTLSGPWMVSASMIGKTYKAILAEILLKETETQQLKICTITAFAIHAIAQQHNFPFYLLVLKGPGGHKIVPSTQPDGVFTARGTEKHLLGGDKIEDILYDPYCSNPDMIRQDLINDLTDKIGNLSIAQLQEIQERFL